MRPVDIERCVGLDRLATWDEVRRANLVSFQDAFELLATSGDFCEINSDSSGYARNLPEDIM